MVGGALGQMVRELDHVLGVPSGTPRIETSTLIGSGAERASTQSTSPLRDAPRPAGHRAIVRV